MERESQKTRRRARKPAPAKGGKAVQIRMSEKRSSARVVFGNVTISGMPPSEARVRENVERSTKALERIGKRLKKPGVTLPKKKGVPRYSVDDNDPTIFIRVLDGSVDRGRVVDGEFEILR